MAKDEIDISGTERDATATPTKAPPGCDACTLGVRVGDDGTIEACRHCLHDGRGHRTDDEATWFVRDSLAALDDVRELLWPMGDPEAAWSPATVDAVARRLDFLPIVPWDTPGATRYCGALVIHLTYDDRDRCYDGKVIVDGTTYSIAVSAPAVGSGPCIADDSPEAYDRAARAALSFAAADLEWGDGKDIFTPAAETDAAGWVIRRRRPPIGDDRTSHYRRALARHLDIAGWARVDRRLTSLETPPRDNPIRRREVLWAWLRDALLWSLEELAERRPLYAFRGLLQAAGYAAEVGHDVVTSDAMTFLRNAIEDEITCCGGGRR